MLVWISGIWRMLWIWTCNCCYFCNESRTEKYVTGYLATIMAADGEIADSEVSLWRLISTLANLPAMNIGEAITFGRIISR